MLYPLRFIPLLKEVVWGGSRLAESGKKVARGVNAHRIGESWELSGMEGSESVVAEGELADNTLSELTEVYMGELVGDGVYEKYGTEFPVLLKFLDARDRLSVQVHPSDEFALEMHGARGKTELWYVVDAEPDGAIYLDLARTLSEEEYDAAVENGTLESYIRRRLVHKGEAFLIPAGTIHSIGGGVLLAEVQEPSDITYRIYDWDRLDEKGHPRELHTALAAEVVCLTPKQGLNVTREPKRGGAVEIAACEHFVVNLIEVAGAITLDYAPLDSYVAYMCVEGEVEIKTLGESCSLRKLQTLLLPAEVGDVVIAGHGKLLEVFTKV